MALRLKLSGEQLRSLRSNQAVRVKDGEPVLGAGGRAALVPSPDNKPWRFLDATQGAPVGFGVYVGKTQATFEVQRKVNGRVMRFSIGDTRDMTLEQAHLRAQELLVKARGSGAHPRAAERKELSVRATKRLTVGDAMGDYHDMLASRQRPATDSTLKMMRNCIARLKRPEVGLADVALLDLDEDQVKKAFLATKLSAALASNRLDVATKTLLEAKVKKALLEIKLARSGASNRVNDAANTLLEAKVKMELTDKELLALGHKTEAERMRVRAAGVSAAEQTFAAAFRAVEFVVDREARQAKKAGRNPALFGNDFQVLYEEGWMRDGKALHNYYTKARVRNPLGEKDRTLGRAIEWLWSRKGAQGGQNATAVDYLLLTLFLGARRNETAPLAWFDRLTPDERTRQSWVWVEGMDSAPKKGKKVTTNPDTGHPGPQVLFFKTKNGRDHNMPLGPFSRAILQARFEHRLPATDPRGKWVFPARSQKAKDGHYKDSKAIMRNLSEHGLSELEWGPTPHDLRRTLGRYAGKLNIPARITSRLFNHLPPKHQDNDQGSGSTMRYQDAEWHELQDALDRVEQEMMASAPAVYNTLKPVEWARLPVGK